MKSSVCVLFIRGEAGVLAVSLGFLQFSARNCLEIVESTAIMLSISLNSLFEEASRCFFEIVSCIIAFSTSSREFSDFIGKKACFRKGEGFVGENLEAEFIGFLLEWT